MKIKRPWVVIGIPENRRVRLFQDALSRRGQSPAIVFSYCDLLSGRRRIDEIPKDAIVRIDSPGENFEVERLLLTAGTEAAECEGAPTLQADEIDRLTFDKGRIVNTRQWYLGFARVLNHWRRFFVDRPDLVVCNPPAEIATMFDKVACHRLCQRGGLPVPPVLGNFRDLDHNFCAGHVLASLGEDCFRSFDDLLAAMDASQQRRVFIKPAHSSSASGVVALHSRRDNYEAITSAEIVRSHGETRLYNSLKIRRYTELEDVRDLIDTILPNRAHVEAWLPKAALQRRVCDLRIVVIAGIPQHMVVRTSRSPLTNLHLGNRRGDVTLLQEKVPSAEWEATSKTCRHAATCFPNSVQFSLDLLFTPGFRNHYVLEVNAFGDLLPNVIYKKMDTYEAQVDALLAKNLCGAALRPAKDISRW